MKLTKGLFIALLLICVPLLYVFLSPSGPKEPDPSSFHLFDNFDDGKDPNMVGGKTFYEVSPVSRLKAKYIDQAEHVYQGRSLEVEYLVPPAGFARLGMEFNELDISKGQYFTFWVRGEKGAEQFDLSIADHKGNKGTVSSDYLPAVTNEWQYVRLSLDQFGPDLDFGRLDYLTWDFTKAGQTNRGTLWIDDIAFHSDQPDLFTRSLMDNIAGFPQSKLAESKRVKELLKLEGQEFVKEVAKDTWIYFRDIVDHKSHLVLDYIQISPQRIVGDFTSITNIGLYFMAVASAYDLGLLPRQAAVDRFQETLKTLGNLPRWKGLWYNYYNTTNMQTTRYYASSVDNGWLAAGLVVARNTFPEVYELCTSYLEGMDFSVLYSESVGQLSLGYEADKKAMSPYHYGLLCTEPRVASYIGIGKGDIPEDHWFRMHRTLPADWDWQDQKPQGPLVENLGVRYMQGHYKAYGMKVVPSWGGSAFEFFMPMMVMDEPGRGAKGLGENNIRAAKAHVKYALEDKGYKVWGMSPCSTPDGSFGGYSEFGVPGIGSKPYPDDGVITPHASILAIELVPEEVIENLKVMLKSYEVYGEYGFYDAFHVGGEQVSYRYMALDQGMSLIAMNNYLNDGIIRKRFHEDEYAKNAEHLLSMENFFPDYVPEGDPVQQLREYQGA